MLSKREFFLYMSTVYEENYHDEDSYKVFKQIVKMTDQDQLLELKEITVLNKKQRMAYRHALAANGKELTPRQLDQYISMVELALEQRH
ncbi:MAG: hypothetical protein ACKOPU_05525 [Candidatus Planktophila sp.]